VPLSPLAVTAITYALIRHREQIIGLLVRNGEAEQGPFEKGGAYDAGEEGTHGVDMLSTHLASSKR
jgi:hypothetical protein